MSLPNPEPTIHQAEWRERRTRLVPALAILLVGLVIGVLILALFLPMTQLIQSIGVVEAIQ